MAEHNTLTGTSLHEAKQISTATTGDAGKVITPSSSSAATGELRNLTESEITGKICYLTMYLPAVDTTAEYYLPVPVAGTVKKIYTVTDAACTGGNQTLTCKINGTGMTNGVITIAASDSDAGDVDSATPSANNVAAAGGYFQVSSGTEATDTLNVTLTFEIERSA